ncbi:hypothetical protein [Pseudomonas sp. BN515]|uniref:hypothetical protein n=1 Tax=Pseudomonas sp. BN515 TaxID=2567892 RepID=UPI002458EBC4|nr:hypothetical protein [Pseudomonas sp. BN515]MDH4874416.1 hypothetical protein [Pseudomonas sp. BN515]
MLPYDQIHPTTLVGIKRLAKTIKKAKGILHAQALDEAAKQAGYQNFRHAQRALSSSAEPGATNGRV